MARGKARVDIESRWDDRGVKQAEQSLDRLHRAGRSALTGLKVSGLAAGAAVGVGLAAAVATGTREMLEQEAVAAQTAARIKSTGEAAHVTAKQVEEMASALQAQTGIADDQIQSMQNMLLTFTNVRNAAGANNDVFNQATRATLDLSVAFEKNLNSSAIMVGKALNDPIQGVTALTRAGVQFTKAQKDQIKALVESGRVMDAQKVILRELATQTGGAAKAAGDTTAGQLERIKRAWEDVSEGLMRGFLPLFSQMAGAALRHMPAIQGTFEAIGKASANALKLISQGKWGELGAKVGRLLARGIAAGLESVLSRIPGGHAIGRMLGLFTGTETTTADFNFRIVGTGGSVEQVGDLVTSGARVVVGGVRMSGRRTGRARGGFIPGRFDGADDIPVNLSRGEVVLNPGQQRIVGVERIVDALRRTGGVIGGDGFATGGIVGGATQAAATFARAQVGEPYVWGAGHSFGDSRGWDCSGFASNVAARVPGYTGGIGTTMTLYPKSRAEGPAPGNYPIAFGFNGMNVNDPRHQHMGVRVNGVWYDAGSGGVQMGRTRWDSGVWIPPGLGGLTTSGGGGPDGGPGVTPDRPAPLIGRKALAALFRRLGSGPAPMTPADALDARITARHRDDSLQDKRARAAGETSARAGGVTNPDKIAAAGEQQVNATRLAELRSDIADTKSAAGKVWHQINLMKKHRKKLYRMLRKAKTRAAQQRFIEALRGARDRLQDLWADYNGLIRQAADLQQEAKELNYDIGELAAEIAGMPNTDTATTSDGADAAPSPDLQAQLDQANARAAAAAANAAGSDAFLRTLRESASIDPGQGGRPIYINVEGSLVRYGELASFVTGALAQQGAPVPGAFGSPA